MTWIRRMFSIRQASNTRVGVVTEMSIPPEVRVAIEIYAQGNHGDVRDCANELLRVYMTNYGRIEIASIDSER